ncbi:MAG: BamA/TamA family outer membrane protein, partial [Burkholderiales bacterium]|nr:BamA/TamA family outer membrane protein [Burkholderiales bacterium]
SAAAAAAGVGVEISAPDELKTLLETHLDLVRLGKLARNEVDGSEWSRLIDATPAQARQLLETEGYFNPVITLQREPAQRAGAADLVKLQVTPGPRARIGKVTIEAEGALQTGAAAGEPHAVQTLALLRRDWALPVGHVFRNGDWNTAKAAALARLRAAGYATAVWIGSGAEVDTATERVQLYLVADSGPLFRYGELEVEGLARQDLASVANLVGAARGAPVTESLLLDLQDRLQKSGLFQTASVTLDPDPARAEDARILVRVHEAPVQTATFGVGVSANTGPRASVEHYFRRPFGYASTVHTQLEYGKLHKFWNTQITGNANADLNRDLLAGTVEQLVSSTDQVLSKRVRLGRTQDTQRIERFYFVEAERSTRQTFDNVINSQAIAVSLNYQGGRRELDSLVLPTRGYTFTGQAGIGRSHGSNAVPGPFTRLYLRATGYLPLGAQWYSQGRIEFGQVFLRSNMVVPESQQFRAGGDESVRGYDYRSLGPIVDGAVGSGNVLYTTSLELAHPIVRSLPALWGAVFVDAGNAGNTFKHLNPAVGLGVGVRWRSPVGPLRVDWAYGRNTRRSKLLFSVGIAF